MADDETTLFHNAVVHTMDDARPRASWLTVEGGRFERVGRGPPPELDRRVDLEGAIVVPGFVDAHAHFFQTGLDLLFVDLAGATTLAEIGRRLAAGDGAPGGWVFAHGFDEVSLSDVDQVTREELDALFGARAVWVNRVDYHSAVVSTAALRELRVPPGTEGLVLGPGGAPNGILRAEAYFRAKSRVRHLYPPDTRARAVEAAARRCVENGITAVHALEGGRVFGDEGVGPILERLPRLPLHVTIFLQEKGVSSAVRAGFEHLGGCILIDGSIGSYTAALSEPYEGTRSRGLLYEGGPSFRAFVEEAHVAGLQLAFHAIGPRAIDVVLDAYERALGAHPRHDHRHRIEHFELATDEQIARARDLGVVIGMQPAFELFWGGPEGMYEKRLGERWRVTNRLREIRDAGLTIAGGSDTNVTPPEPLLGIHAAVNHPNEEQRLGARDALRMMTLDAARAAFDEGEHGSIEPGKQASFAVLDRDPLAVDPSALRDTRVLSTWYRGRRVYQRPGSVSG